VRGDDELAAREGLRERAVVLAIVVILAVSGVNHSEPAQGAEAGPARPTV